MSSGIPRFVRQPELVLHVFFKKKVINGLQGMNTLLN